MSQGVHVRNVSPPVSVWIFNGLMILATLIFMTAVGVFTTDFTQMVSVVQFIFMLVAVTGLIWLQTLAFNEVYEDVNSTAQMGKGVALWFLYGGLSYIWYVSFVSLGLDFSLTYFLTWGSVFMLHAIVMVPAIIAGYFSIYVLWG